VIAGSLCTAMMNVIVYVYAKSYRPHGEPPQQDIGWLDDAMIDAFDLEDL